MRIIKIGEKEVGIKASPLSLLYYRQAFGSDLIKDLIKFKDAQKDPANIDVFVLLQMVWAMARAFEGPGKPFKDFETWLAEFDEFDFSDESTMKAIMEEAMDGFFRRAGQTKQRK